MINFGIVFGNFILSSRKFKAFIFSWIGGICCVGTREVYVPKMLILWKKGLSNISYFFPGWEEVIMTVQGASISQKGGFLRKCFWWIIVNFLFYWGGGILLYQGASTAHKGESLGKNLNKKKLDYLDSSAMYICLSYSVWSQHIISSRILLWSVSLIHIGHHIIGLIFYFYCKQYLVCLSYMKQIKHLDSCELLCVWI